MKKLLIICLGLVSCLPQRGCSDHQKMQKNPKPWTVLSKPVPYTNHMNCYITLRAKDGNVFTLDEEYVACGMCNNYNVGDTIR